MIPVVEARNVQKDIGNDRSYVESNNNTAIPLEREVNDWSFILSSHLPNGSIRRVYKNNDGKYGEYIMRPDDCKFAKIGNVSDEELANIRERIENASKQIANTLQTLSKK